MLDRGRPVAAFDSQESPDVAIHPDSWLSLSPRFGRSRRPGFGRPPAASTSTGTSARCWPSIATPATGRASRREGSGSIARSAALKGGDSGPAIVPGQSGREPDRAA